MQRFGPMNLSIDYLINLGCRIMINKGEGKGKFITKGIHKWFVEGRSNYVYGIEWR